MAIAPPELTIKIKYDTQSQEREQQKLARDMESRARRLEQTLADQATRGEAERTKIRVTAEERRAQAAANALQRQKLAWERHWNNLAITEEKARARSLKGQESWSARMTKSVDSLAMSVRGFALAWGATQITGIVRDSLNFAGGMRDAAAGVNLTTQQFFALTSALRDAGVQAEKIDPMLTRLGELTTGGASEKQQAILDRLGINATAMSNVQLLDTLLKSINERTITQAELGELVGNRVVPAWNRLAGEINSVNEAQSRYKMPLTDAEIDRLDEASRKWESLYDNIKLFLADITVSGGLGGGIAAAAMARDRAALDRYEQFVNDIRSNPFRGVIQSSVPFGPPEPTRPAGPPSRIPRPVDMSGRALSRAIPQSDRSFDLPQITQQLPVAQRQTEAWNKSLETTVSLADRIELSVSRVASSSTWQIAQAGAQAFTSVLSMQAQLIQNQLDGLNQLMQVERERWQVRSEALREAGLESSAAYRNELREFERLDKARMKRAQELQAKAFEVNKRAQIAGTTMNTAQAVMNALATVKPFVPVGLIMAALASAQGAVQVATIAGQQNPYKGYAFGGYVPGHTNGDEQPILTMGGEFVVNRESTRRNRAALEYANRGGDIAPSGNSGMTIVIQGDILTDDYWVEQRLIPRLRKAVDRGYAIA